MRTGSGIGRRKKDHINTERKKPWRVKSHDQKNLRRSPKNPIMPGDDDALLKIIIKRKKRRLEGERGRRRAAVML